MIRLQQTHALVKDEISESETAMGRFDPENSEQAVCLDYGQRDGVPFRGSVGVSVGVDEVAVVDGDGSVSARFEVCFASWDERGGLDEVDIGGIESGDDPSV